MLQLLSIRLVGVAALGLTACLSGCSSNDPALGSARGGANNSGDKTAADAGSGTSAAGTLGTQPFTAGGRSGVGMATGGAASGSGGGAVVGGAASGGAAGATSGGATSGGAAGATSGGGGSPTSGAGGGPEPTLAAGNPDGSCKNGTVPAEGKLVDTSQPTTVVGSGSANSCTAAALSAAIAKGGIVTFNCGSSPTRIAVTSTINVPTDRDTVVDGGNRVTLDGGKTTQILRFDSPDFRANDHGLTLQRITLANGKTTPKEAIPVAPAPCSQGYNDGEGGALYMRDGSLTVIDSVFTGNQAAQLGPDTGGGAIYVLGSKRGALVVHSSFIGNSASNAGALGGLFAELRIYDSLFSGNQAVGNGANSDDASKCSAMNNGQHEVGSGGNGGAIYSDGASVNVTLCGDKITDNHAGTGAFGGGLFFTSNDLNGTLTIIDTTMTGNSGGSWTNAASGTVKNLGSAVGTNTKGITLMSSTLQGL